MRRNKGFLNIVTTFAVFAIGTSLLVHHNITPIRVEAAQHTDNYSSYTYSGSYYDSINFSDSEGLNGQLRQSLTTLTLPKAWYEYSGTGSGTLAEVLQEADEDPTNSNNMVYLYTRDSVTKNAASSWNREHVWPRSLGPWQYNQAGADLLHIRPTYTTTNSKRGNLLFGDNSKSGAVYYNDTMLYGYTGGSYFEPIDSVKGDVARIVMYLWVAYQDYYSSSFPITNVFQSYDVLLNWHTMDKPDVMEGNRNDYAEGSNQKNRNPFVDHPELAWKIFGDSASSSVKTACQAAYPDSGSSSGSTDPTSISLNKSSASLEIGNTLQLSASLQPSGATGTITWSSNNTSIATVNSTGLVTAKAAGTATITASINGLTATCVVTVLDENASSTYEKIASYDFSSGNTSTLEYSDSTLLSRFNSSAVTGDGLSDIVNAVSNSSKVYAGYASYYNFGIKFGTSSVNGTFTLSLDKEVIRVVVNASGWSATDSLAVSDASSQIPGVAYNDTDPIKTLTYDIPSTDSVTFTFAKRGFVQSIDFYTLGESVIDPTSFLNNSSTIASLHGTETVTSASQSGSIVFADLSLQNAVQYLDPFEIGNGFASITFSGGDNDGKYYTTGSGIRTYGNGTITVTSSYQMTNIAFVFSGSSYKPESADVVNVGTYNVSSGVWTGSSNSITLTRPSGSGHWRLQSVTVTCGGSISVSSVAVRFGATLTKSNWDAITSKWTISDYGVMLLKQTTLNNYGFSSVEAAYRANDAEKPVTILSKGSGDAPYLDDDNNYLFTVKVNVKEANYGVVFCAAPFIVVNGEYRFLDEMQYSVNTLAQYYLENGGSNLSDAALTVLANS